MENKQDLRIIKTTMALQNSFLELLKEKNFEDITVGEICDRAMVRRATFYNHYSDKYDFLEKFMRQKAQIFQQELEEQHQAENIVDLTANMFVKFIDFAEEQHFSQSTYSNHLFSILIPIMTDIVQASLEKSLLELEQKNDSPSVEHRVIAGFCAGGILQLAKSWLLHPQESDKETLFKELHQLLSDFFLSIA